MQEWFQANGKEADEQLLVCLSLCIFIYYRLCVLEYNFGSPLHLANGTSQKMAKIVEYININICTMYLYLSNVNSKTMRMFFVGMGGGGDYVIMRKSICYFVEDQKQRKEKATPGK